MASSSRSRSRNKKKVATRMDAAYDHLIPFGFSKKEISTTVKSLLKVYGEEGWVFLEENSYKLVIETIIDQKNTNDDEPSLPQLPAPHLPALPAPEEQNGEEQQANGRNKADMGMEEQMACNGGGSMVATGLPAGIQFMDESLLHVIPPGRLRAPLYGYLSETDSDVDIEPAITSP